MSRLPVPGSDDGVWGEVLNDFLATSHTANGALKNGIVTPNKLSQAYVPNTSVGQPSGVAALDGSGKVPLAQIPAGSQGPAGKDGKTVLNGSGIPVPTIGADGDFYIDTATNLLYGPKSSGVWGSGVSLVGPQGPSGANSDVYPLSEYGFLAVSCRPEDANSNSTVGNWVTRIYIPAGVTITSIGLYINQTDPVATGLNAFGVYTDAGTFVAATPSDPNLWATAGWTMRALSAPIAAQPSSRYVRVAINFEGTVTTPNIAYAFSGIYNGIAGGSYRRSYYVSSSRISWPATIDVVNEGQVANYIPLLAIA